MRGLMKNENGVEIRAEMGSQPGKQIQSTPRKNRGRNRVIMFSRHLVLNRVYAGNKVWRENKKIDLKQINVRNKIKKTVKQKFLRFVAKCTSARTISTISDVKKKIVC